MEKSRRLVSSEERFYTMALDFLDYVREIAGDDSVNYIDKARCLVEFMDHEDVVDIFIKHYSTNFPIIKSKDSALLISSLDSFHERVSTKLSKICTVLFSNDRTEEEVDEIWSKLSTLVRCSINYMYDIEQSPDTIEVLAKEWDVDLGIEIFISDDESDSE